MAIGRNEHVCEKTERSWRCSQWRRAAPRGGGLGQRRLNRLLVPNVEFESVHVEAFVPRRSSERLCLVEVSHRGGHAVAPPGQLQGGQEPEAAAATGDEGDSHDKSVVR